MFSVILPLVMVMPEFREHFPTGDLPILAADHQVVRSHPEMLADGFPVVRNYCKFHVILQ
jgi:hypothetical protein